ncbi:fimbrillin family protein [Bacteroides fragilis]|nr:fimbrillin family protein [Bacteroides fragilis]
MKARSLRPGGRGSRTRAVAADNGYDRSTFAAGDKIRIIRSRNGSSSTPVDYILNAASSGSSTGEWKPSVTGTELLVESGATYQASYPIEYSGIRADQRKAGGEDYRLSNLLETPEKVTIGRDGTLSFTGESAFVHKGVKLTLKFSGKHTLSKDFTSMTVTRKGLYSGGASKDETVYLYHPSGTGDAKYTWHGIIAPLTSQQSIQVSVTDANGVVYDVTLTCARAANSHYTYTLTLKNDVLVPTGQEIKEWQSGDSHTGTLS